MKYQRIRSRESPLVKELLRNYQKISLHQEVMRSDPNLLKDHSTQSMRRENQRLSHLLDLENMRHQKRDQRVSLLVRDLERELLKMLQHLDNMSRNPSSLKGHSTPFTKRESQR